MVPALIAMESLLEVKACLPVLSTNWAKTVYGILKSRSSETLEVLSVEEPVIVEKPKHTPTLDDPETLLNVLRESLKVCSISFLTTLHKLY